MPHTLTEIEAMYREADVAEREALWAEAHLGRFIMAYLDANSTMPKQGDVLRANVADARTKRDIANRAMRRATLAADEALAA